VDSHAHLRLFVAFPLPDDALDRLTAWQRALPVPAGVRLVPRESLHVTVAFLGHRPAGDAEPVAEALRAAAAHAGRPVLRAVRYRETRAVGMVVLSDEEGRAAAIADDVFERLERLGVYRREARPWLPHVTVCRFRRAPRLRPEPPDLGEVCPSDLALYTSVLRRGGAQYDVLESVPLGG
jgi:2'-5' RNA ligase